MALNGGLPESKAICRWRPRVSHRMGRGGMEAVGMAQRRNLGADGGEAETDAGGLVLPF